MYDSDSEFAISLKLVVKNKIEEGLSKDQIYNFLSEKYGEWILYDPELNKNTYILWLFPILIFLLALALSSSTDASGEELDFYMSCGICNFCIGAILILISWNYSGQQRKSQKSIKFQRRMRDKYD